MVKRDKSTFSIKEVLNEYLLKHKDVGYRIKALESLKIWRNVVESYIQQHTEPVHIKDRVLFVNTDSAALANELSLREKELREKLNRTLETPLVKKIVFKSGLITQEKKKKGKLNINEKSLNIKTLSRIDKTVAHIKEDELREIMKKLLITSAKRHRET